MKIFKIIKMMVGLSPNCEKVNLFLADYVDGTLDDKTRKDFEEHMDMCKCCRPYLNQYKSTIEMAHECDDVKVPSELVEHTMAFLRRNSDFPRS